MNPRFSVVIPFFNEAESLDELYQRLVAALEPLGSFEIIFIDDGSTDQSFTVAQRLFTADRRVRVIKFRRNLGKSAALSQGFQGARGELVVTIDADLQDEPREIPRLVEALDRFDLVTGWKQQRNDPWTKRFPSKVFNGAARLLFGVRLNDLNSGLKVMRREVATAIDLYGEFHRFVPILAFLQGFRIGEVPVGHHQRKYGQSKYGWKRFVRGALDLMTVAFLGRFANRPLHLFGTLGLGCFGLGFVIALYLTIIWWQGQSIGQRPLLTFAVLLMLTGLQFLFTGLLAELITSRSAPRRYPVEQVLDRQHGNGR
ncbi:MAG: glycosyltransferase family 2 protein [Candidatus Kerfeldbacteria bacterium]|nr:glycosyltransferase family 2 protein [Candidatus Kerfeldbacteria bacterium]